MSKAFQPELFLEILFSNCCRGCAGGLVPPGRLVLSCSSFFRNCIAQSFTRRFGSMKRRVWNSSQMTTLRTLTSYRSVNYLEKKFIFNTNGELFPGLPSQFSFPLPFLIWAGKIYHYDSPGKL